MLARIDLALPVGSGSIRIGLDPLLINHRDQTPSAIRQQVMLWECSPTVHTIGTWGGFVFCSVLENLFYGC